MYRYQVILKHEPIEMKPEGSSKISNYAYYGDIIECTEAKYGSDGIFRLGDGKGWMFAHRTKMNTDSFVRVSTNKFQK